MQSDAEHRYTDDVSFNPFREHLLLCALGHFAADRPIRVQRPQTLPRKQVIPYRHHYGCGSNRNNQKGKTTLLRCVLDSG